MKLLSQIIIIVIFISCMHLPCNAQMRTSLPFLPIDSGYGAKGRYSVKVDSIKHPVWEKHSVYLFHPGEITAPVPVIFFCHGIGADNPAVYQQLIDHCVSRGLSVVYTPFEMSSAMVAPLEMYTSVWNGCISAVKSWSSMVDTARIGFTGHSYGAGALPSFTYKAVTQKNWGSKGVFMFLMAPWYSYELTDSLLKSFPPNVKLVVEIFNDDHINDHRMAIDIFQSIAIPDTEKDFITLYSDSSQGVKLVAGHELPEGTHRWGWNVDAFDYYGVWKILDALCDYTFNNNTAAKSVCLGNGSKQQRFMGKWSNGKLFTPLEVTDAPQVKYVQTRFVNFWNHTFNPRAKIQRYFDSSMSVPVSSSTTINNYKSLISSPDWKTPAVEESKQQSDTIVQKKLAIDSVIKDVVSNSEVLDSIEDNNLWPIMPIEKGFGSRGSYKVNERYIAHPAGGKGDLYCFTPENYSGKMPLLFFSPKLNESGKVYRQLLLYIASNGYKVITTVNQSRQSSSDNNRYDAMLSGFEAVLETEKQFVDTTRIGFAGHAYGAGASLAISWYYIKKKHWGSNECFLFLMSPSYVYYFSDEQFAAYSGNVNMVIEVFEEDHFNDHRIAEDIFYSINIPPSCKDFIYIKSAVHGSFDYDADFQLPEAEDDDGLKPLQQYGIIRPLHALIEATFNHDSSAYDIALGNGCKKQTFMGTWWDGTPVSPLVSTDAPMFHNIKWAKQLSQSGLPSIIGMFYSSLQLCPFSDDKNPRKTKIVP